MKTRVLVLPALLIVLAACVPSPPPTAVPTTPAVQGNQSPGAVQGTTAVLPTFTPLAVTRTPPPPTGTPLPTLQGIGERDPETFVPGGAVIETQSYGDYQVRLYKEGEVQGCGKTAFEVLKNGKRIFVYEGLCRLEIGRLWAEGAGADETLIIPIGEDVTGNGVPDLVVFEWAGGAYCCAMHHIYELGQEFRYVDTIGSGDYPLEAADLDQDGSLEFTIHDGCFRSFQGWPRAAGTYDDPKVILHYTDGGYQAAVELMRKPAPSSEELLALAEQYQDQAEWELSRQVAFWGILLDLIYSGHADLVEPFLEVAWPDDPARREAYVETIRTALPGCEYWPGILELNPGWPLGPL